MYSYRGNSLKEPCSSTVCSEWLLRRRALVFQACEDLLPRMRDAAEGHAVLSPLYNQLDKVRLSLNPNQFLPLLCQHQTY